MTLTAVSRRRMYSALVSVCEGATTIESPGRDGEVVGQKTCIEKKTDNTTNCEKDNAEKRRDKVEHIAVFVNRSQ